MGGTWGRSLKLSIFGESHGEAIGIVVDGLPAGIAIDEGLIACDMRRRAPGRDSTSTQRKEDDDVKIVSGMFNGKTTGAPICGIIYNTNTKSKDYSGIKDLLRPGHADYSAMVKNDGFNDYRGSGHFSGRITAPFVFAGSLARQYLSRNGIEVAAHISSIADIVDIVFDASEISAETLTSLRNSGFPLLDPNLETQMRDAIWQAKAAGDSLGGTIECAAVGMPAGWGDPFFDSIESSVASLAFSIPAVKGIEFGAGFSISEMRGSEANDEFYYSDDLVRTRTNNNGGINGGITNSMPIVFKVAIKPTPSISKEQNTVNIVEKKEQIISTKGRHDPCIVLRAVPVVESALLIALCDAALMEEK